MENANIPVWKSPSRSLATVEQTIEWLNNKDIQDLTFEELVSYWKVDNSELKGNRYDFCNEQVYENLSNAKNVFNEYAENIISVAKGKANPFETLYNLFFMNRAALKLANIDAVTDFMFTNVENSEHHCNSKGPFYFADVCAGPGGFTEYILWRKSWLYKGFGITLKDEDRDFRLNQSLCTTPYNFQAFYGHNRDGDICCLENIDDFKKKVLFQTHQQGVHFMTSDGGFCVKGKEHLQEVLSKNIYLCQCLIALEIVRPHGNFVTKMFDVFTRFSVGLIYLMYKCFVKVTILKPNTSRPANGERYLICCDLKKNEEVTEIRNYLRFVAEELRELEDQEENAGLELVSVERIKNDTMFYNYILRSNNCLGQRQTVALRKLRDFCGNSFITNVRSMQNEYRNLSLKYFNLPDILRSSLKDAYIKEVEKTHERLNELVWLHSSPSLPNGKGGFLKICKDSEQWSFCSLYSERGKNKCNIYAAFGKKTRRFQDGTWIDVNDLKLTPGTILYGEIVKETLKLESTKEKYRVCVHIIDAMYLGDLCLTDLSFSKRMELIKVFSESLNQESVANRIRIRKKPIHALNYDSLCSIIRKYPENFRYNLPILGFESEEEMFTVGSVLLMKTERFSSDVPQQLMFGLRAQIFLDQEDASVFEALKNMLS